MFLLLPKLPKFLISVLMTTLQYYSLNQWPAFVDISYLLTYLCWLPEANTIYKRPHAVPSITINFTMNFFLLKNMKHMKYGYFIIWKLQNNFKQRVKKILFLSLTKIISLTYVPPTCKRSDDLNKTSQESRTSVRASYFIIAGNLIIHSVCPFNKLHGEDGGNWIGLIHKIVTCLQICQFYFIA